MKNTESPEPKSPQELYEQADQEPVGLVREFWLFLRYNKKWWMIPILIALAVLGLFVFLSNTVLAPFIYPF